MIFKPKSPAIKQTFRTTDYLNQPAKAPTYSNPPSPYHKQTFKNIATQSHIDKTLPKTSKAHFDQTDLLCDETLEEMLTNKSNSLMCQEELVIEGDEWKIRFNRMQKLLATYRENLEYLEMENADLREQLRWRHYP